MSNPPDTNLKAAAKELLLEDYRTLADTLWKNEQTGETRVNWYLGIVTAAVGGLIGLTGSQHRPQGNSIRLIFMASLLALVAFGVITLFRIMKRNATTDGYKEDSKTIRAMFKQHFDDADILVRYAPFSGSNDKGVARKLGGLAHTVLTVNSLLVGGLIAALVLPLPVPRTFEGGLQTRNLLTTCLAAVAAFGVALIGQFVWVQKADERAKSKLCPKTTHAGGIVYRMIDGEAQYLLVRPKKRVEPEEWVFPKGHIERNEEECETAVREVREETGCVARLFRSVGTDEYNVGKARVIPKFYLMEFIAQGKSEEERETKWFAYDNALKALTHAGSQSLLRDAESKRRETNSEKKSK